MSTTSSFKKTTVHLGKSKMVHVIDPKAKFKPPASAFCAYCFLTVDITMDGKCTVCSNKITRKTTFKSLIKKFTAVCNANSHIMDDWIADSPQNEHLQIPMPFGQKTLMVPLRYFKEFENLESTDQSKDDAYDAFFCYLKIVCHEVKGW